uniref:Vomeronasal type-1 receptor n=1 Tax=Erpetoichthys calabaricus TaxID=27687 RepID=A0A8C4STX8_ERPCA
MIYNLCFKLDQQQQIYSSLYRETRLIASSVFLQTQSHHHGQRTRKLMTADIILCHLALVNLLVAFVRSIPQTLAAFGYQNLFDDLGCKLSLLCFRILRGLSISLTCLLSTYQAVLIAPASSKLLAPLKHRIPKYLPHIFLCLYVFCSITSVHTILYAVSKLVNNTIPPYTFNLDYCFVRYTDYSAYLGTGFTNFLRDFIFIVLMAVMSAYILILLYRHSQKVKHIRSSDRGHSGARAETRASQVVVTLVILYVIFFGVDNAIWLYSLSTVRKKTDSFIYGPPFFRGSKVFGQTNIITNIMIIFSIWLKILNSQ